MMHTEDVRASICRAPLRIDSRNISPVSNATPRRRAPRLRVVRDVSTAYLQSAAYVVVSGVNSHFTILSSREP